MLAALLASLTLITTAAGPSLPVSAAHGCLPAPTRTELVDGASACTITAAERVAQPGDHVTVAAGAYPPTRLTASGTTTDPIVVAADGAVTIAGNARAELNLTGVHDVVVSGISITGGSLQGVWIDAAARVSLVGVSVIRSGGHGVQVNASTAVTIATSRVSKNRLAGIMETGADSHSSYLDDHVAHNGSGGSRYLGSGIELAGVDSRIIGGLIKDNGISRLYEHGVYVASVASGWLIKDATITGSSGADVKAGGSAGAIVGSTLGSARLGVYAIGRGITLSGDTVRGAFHEGLVIAAGSTVISRSIVANSGAGYGSRAEAAVVYAGARVHQSLSRLYLRGLRVKMLHLP
jgi:hypothetical protein